MFKGKLDSGEAARGMDSRGVDRDRQLGGPVGLLRKLVNSKLVNVLTGITLATGAGTGYLAYKVPAIEARLEQNLNAELKQVLSDYVDLLDKLIDFAVNLGMNNDVGFLNNAKNLVTGARALYDGGGADIQELKGCYDKLNGATEMTLEGFRQIEGTPLGDCLTLDQLLVNLKELNLTPENRVALQKIIAQNNQIVGKLNELTTTEFWSAAGWKAAKQEVFGSE